jgi:cytidylate kinase
MAVISISRGTFSGGKAIAEKLAEHLQYPCVSREMILEDAANDFGVAEEHLEHVVNERPKPWQQNRDRRAAYLNFIRAALLRRSRDGKLVYHGHVGHLLLSGVANILRVRVIAGEAWRIEAAMKDFNIDRKAAIAQVKKDDAHTIKWTRFLYGVEWGDPFLYDLIVNLEQVSIDTAIQTIVQMAQSDDFRPNDSFRATFEDQMLSSLVWCALAKAELATAADVAIQAKNGLVTISGTTQSDQQANTIIEAAENTKGVKSVISKMRVGTKWYW